MARFHRPRSGRGFGACGRFDAYLEPPDDMWAYDLLERSEPPAPPPVVGYVTHLGYLICAKCREPMKGDAPVLRDSYPHAFEACDRCKLPLQQQR